MSPADHIQVLTTVDSEEEAVRLSQALVGARLAACVKVTGPISSRYRWKGSVEVEREWQCMAVTAAAMYSEVEEAIRRHHSYEEPEIVATPIVAGSAGYLAWVDGQLSGK